MPIQQHVEIRTNANPPPHTIPRERVLYRPKETEEKIDTVELPGDCRHLTRLEPCLHEFLGDWWCRDTLPLPDVCPGNTVH